MTMRWAREGVVALALASIALATAALAPAVRARGSKAPRLAEPAHRSSTELAIPHRHGALEVDGEFEDAAWQSCAHTGAFVGKDGEPVHPHSEARVVWDEENLYLLLYAADENIVATQSKPDGPVWLEDSFHFVISNGEEDFSFDISPKGIVADGRRRTGAPASDGSRRFDPSWQSEIKVATDADGTLNDPSDDDEEWVLEIAIPLRSIHASAHVGARLGFAVHRCDTPKGGVRVCGGWPAEGHEGTLRFDIE